MGFFFKLFVFFPSCSTVLIAASLPHIFLPVCSSFFYSAIKYQIPTVDFSRCICLWYVMRRHKTSLPLLKLFSSVYSGRSISLIDTNPQQIVLKEISQHSAPLSTFSDNTLTNLDHSFVGCRIQLFPSGQLQRAVVQVEGREGGTDPGWKKEEEKGNRNQTWLYETKWIQPSPGKEDNLFIVKPVV